MGYAVAVVREVAVSSYGPDAESRIDNAIHDLGDDVRDNVIDDLGDEIATLAAHIHAATHRFLVLIARFDRLRGWEVAGHRSCAYWLSHRTGLDLGTAREHVRVARALEDLPQTGESMSRGELSFSKVRALSRVAEASNEADLLELARGCTTAQLERMVRAWKKGSRADEADLERERHESRSLSIFPDEDGMYAIRGRLDPEVGAVLMRAVEAASDVLYRARTPVPASEHGAAAARRRADAIGLLAERALSAGFAAGDSAESRGRSERNDGRSDGRSRLGARAERYQVMLHVEPETLAAGDGPGRSDLEDGTNVSAETCRRISCDAGLVRVDRAADGSVLNVGRRTRTIPPALRRALEVRDRGCRFPGCGLRFTEGHHITHWADGGETSLDNTVLLCRYHHRWVHEEGWEIEWWGKNRPAFRDPSGSVHCGTSVGGRGSAGDGEPARPGAADGCRRTAARPVGRAESLTADNRRRGVAPNAWTANARWRREADIPDRVLFAAIEAAL